MSPFFSVRGGPVGETFDLPVGFDGGARTRWRGAFRQAAADFDRLFALMETVQTGVVDLNRARAERSSARCCAASWNCAR